MAAWYQSIRVIRRINVPSPFRLTFRWICLPEHPTGLDHHIQSVADLTSCVTPLLKHYSASTGILNLFPITYAFRPRLRGRLTLGGRTFPRKSWNFGGQDSHLAFRYSCPHNHFYAVHAQFPLRFNPHRTLLYHWRYPKVMPIRSFGSRFSPDHFRRKTTRPVSYYALFKWWLLLSQHPGCHCNSTSFPT